LYFQGESLKDVPIEKPLLCREVGKSSGLYILDIYFFKYSLVASGLLSDLRYFSIFIASLRDSTDRNPINFHGPLPL